MRNSSTRSIRLALAVYLTKLRQGIGNSMVATIFRLSKSEIIFTYHSSSSPPTYENFLYTSIFGLITRLGMMF